MLPSLSSRLKVGIGAILAAFSIAGTVSVVGVALAARDLGRAVDATVPTISAVDRMKISILKQNLFAIAYSATSGATGLPEIADERRAFEAARAELVAIWGEKEGFAAGVVAEYGLFVALGDELVEATDALAAAQRNDAVRAPQARFQSGTGDLEKRLALAQAQLLGDFDGEVTEPIFAALKSARSRATDAAWRSLAVFGGMILIASAFAAFVGAMLTRGFRAPMARLVEATERIAGGDRGARLEDVGIEEFRELASSFNDMAERLDEAEQGLVRSYEAQRKMLDEIPVGLLTIGPDFRIGPEYSAATDRILGRQGVAGTRLTELLAPGPGRSTGEGALGLDRYLRQLFENTTADKDFLDDINPVRSFALQRPDGERSLEVGFDRLYDGQRVSDVLVTIADKTDVIAAERALEEARRSHKRDSDSIQAILAIGPGPLRDFFAEARETVARVRARLDGLGSREAVDACFRELHSIKGSAGSFGIDAVAMTAHEAEDIFAALRGEGREPTTPELVRINILLGKVGEELDSFEELVQRLKDSLSRLEASESDGAARSELAEFVESMGPMVSQLARSLVKPMDLVTDIRAEGLPHLREMRTVVIHLIRNAADHGIEDEYERLFQGKPRRGTIKLSIGPKDGELGSFVIEVEDDGQGLNFDRIAERGRALGFIPAGERLVEKGELLSLLFRPGFSTKDKVDEISGRGVGLDLVRDIVKSVGGRISVGSIRGRGTRFSVTIPA